MHTFWRDEATAKARFIGLNVDAAASKRAVMRIFDPIDRDGAPWGVSAKDVAQALAELPDDVDSLELHLNSPGGNAFEGVAILNSLRQHSAKVDVVVDGLAASAASLIAMAGDAVSMAPGSQMMIHDASALAVGPADVMRQAADMLDKTSESYAEIYAARAGGTAAEWRAAMQPGTWYRAQEAVDAGLADRVLASGATTVEEPAARFDLTVYADARRQPFIPKANQTPAQPPVHVPTTPEEADTMSDTLMKALRERLSLGDDADEAAVLAKADELLEQATTPNGETEPPAAVDPTDEQIAAYLEKTGKAVVSQVKLDELETNSKLGVEARQQQLTEARDAAVEAAFKAGKISADRRDTWKAAWDLDPEGTKADLDSLEARFPVAQAKGYAGAEVEAGEQPFSDDDAEALAALTGTTKEALLNG